MSLPSLAEVEHADWPTLKTMCAAIGLNPKGRSGIVRMRVLDYVRRRARSEPWRLGSDSQAALLTRLGFPDEATRLWESTIRLDLPAPWIGLGRSYLAAGELQEASKSFDRAAQMGDSVAHLHRAEALAAGGNPEAAVRACDAYLTARPGDLRGLLLKAGFLARGGWTDEASAVLRTAFEAHPHAEGLWRGLGLVLLRGGRPEPAAEAFHEAVRADPKDEAAWVNRGVSLLQAGRHREAVGALREVLELDSRHAVALNDLGIAYLKTGQAKSALVNLERASKHLEVPTVLLNMARLQERERMRPEALATFERILRIKPRDAEARAGKKRLLPRRTPTHRARKRGVRRPKGKAFRKPRAPKRSVSRKRKVKPRRTARRKPRLRGADRRR